MNTRFTVLLMTSLAGLMLSGQTLATPRFLEGDWLAAREEREYGRQEEREARKARKYDDRKSEDKYEDDKERERGYGYGYERRSQRPQQPDDRRRR